MKYILENKVFNSTLYEVPSIDMLKRFDDTDLTNEEIYKEISYTIVGKGILSHSNKLKIMEAVKKLVDYNIRYNSLLEISRKKFCRKYSR